jgi:hypothetical protein
VEKSLESVSPMPEVMPYWSELSWSPEKHAQQKSHEDAQNVHVAWLWVVSMTTKGVVLLLQGVGFRTEARKMCV